MEVETVFSRFHTLLDARFTDLYQEPVVYLLTLLQGYQDEHREHCTQHA